MSDPVKHQTLQPLIPGLSLATNNPTVWPSDMQCNI